MPPGPVTHPAATVGPAAGAVAHRVMWQVADGGAETYDKVLRNIDNVLVDFAEETISIEVVAHGAGLPLLLSATPGSGDHVRALIDQGVTFLACENTMARQHVDAGELLPDVGTVPSGIAAIVRRQGQGWSYLRG